MSQELSLHQRRRAPRPEELDGIPWLALLQPAERERAHKALVVGDAQSGDYVCRTGRAPTYWFGVVEGLLNYPYGCTEQTLNRFVPTVITLSLLQKLEVDLAAVREKRTNLNAQEIGDPMARAKGWKRFNRNPVFDPEEVKTMTKDGIKALQNMQLADGGWGWFSGFGEFSYPHTTAIVVHGLQLARDHKVVLPANMLERGVA